MNRLRAAALLAFAAVAVAHVVAYGDWVVEDAAISWAYGRNLALGLGAVPWPGAEPVEGFSNPTWVALIAVFQLVGVHPFWSTKFLAMALTACTVPVVARLGERAAPDWPVPTGLAAAALFAVNAQVGIFGAAGLENPLFNLLLAAALLRGLAEHDAPDQAPWSAVLLLLLALTRPEGIVYAGVLGVLSTAWRLRAGRDRVELSRWWLALLGPLLLWHFARWNYFAWALPATAYAKVPESRSHLLVWDGPGWRYLRDYLWGTGQGFLLPLMVVATTGLRGRAAAIAAVTLVTAALVYGYPDASMRWFDLRWEPIAGLGELRCVFPAAAAAVVWFASLTTPGAAPRGTMWALGVMVSFFAVYTKGDWMEGARWMAMAAVPFSVLAAAGAAEVAGLLVSAPAARLRPLAPVTVALGLAQFQVLYAREFSQELEISPWMVRTRVWMGEEIIARLGVDERPTCLTVDMGGFLMWSDWKLLDIVGLVDMPMAQHRNKPWFDRFFLEYVVDEERPHLIRIGTVLARAKLSPAFQQQYFRGQYGWRVRRDLLFSDRWPGPPGREVPFEGTTLVGWDVPEPKVAPGSEVHLELGLDNDDDRNLRWWAFLVDDHNGVAAAWDLPETYPETEDWPDDAVLHQRLTLDLPDEVGPGRYRLGFAMRTSDALNGPRRDAVLPPGVHVAWRPEQAMFRWGEVVYPDGIEVVSPEAAAAEAADDHARALDLAVAGDCEGAHDAWKRARWHGLGEAWEAERAPTVARARATCWSVRAEREPEQVVDHLERALDLDPELPGLRDTARRLAERRSAEGDREREAGRPGEAYRAYRDALRLDPYRTWDRRHAEELRLERFEAAEARRDAARTGGG